jgi:hypothetical protein
MPDEKKTIVKVVQDQPSTVKVEVVGPGSVICASGTIAPGNQTMLTATEYESVKGMVKKI